METVTALEQSETRGKSIIDVQDKISHIALKLEAIKMMFYTEGSVEAVTFSPDARDGMCFIFDGLVDELRELTKI